MSKLLCAFTASVHHGCLILRDVGSTADHAQWDPRTSAQEMHSDSIIFKVQAAVDGPVNVRVWRGEAEPGGPAERYFSGTVRSAHGRLVLHDPNEDVSLTFRVVAGTNSFTVTTDSTRFPEVLDIVFHD
jgi:hypothetical protein